MLTIMHILMNFHSTHNETTTIDLTYVITVPRCYGQTDRRLTVASSRSAFIAR